MESNQEVALTHQQLLFKSALTGKRKVEQRCLKSGDIAGLFSSWEAFIAILLGATLKNSNGKSSLAASVFFFCWFAARGGLNVAGRGGAFLKLQAEAQLAATCRTKQKPTDSLQKPPPSQSGTAAPRRSICVCTFRPRTRETDASVRACVRAALSAPDGSHPATEG